jgi:uncharacterized protein
MKFVVVLCILFLLGEGISLAQEKAPEPEFKLKQYFLVLLKRGPNKDLDSLQRQEVQKGHMAHINKMAEDKKLVMAGPFGDDTDLRGIFIFDVPTMEDAVALTEADPAVKAGRLIMEIHPWYASPGTCLP